jgi:hypothetical protein
VFAGRAGRLRLPSPGPTFLQSPEQTRTMRGAAASSPSRTSMNPTRSPSSNAAIPSTCDTNAAIVGAP